MDSSGLDLFDDETPIPESEVSASDLTSMNLKGTLMKKGGSKGGKGHAWKERWFSEIVLC